MERKRITQVKMVCDSDYARFEEALNSAIQELSSYSPEVSDVQLSESKGFWSTIKYTTTYTDVSTMTVRDEYHLEGYTFLCRECPLHDEVTDGRKVRCSCKYADYGITRLDSECCELFYKKLKQGEIKVEV